MIRKLIWGAVAAAALGGIVAGRDVFSYARTGVASARDRFRRDVPIEFEIARAHGEVERLLPEVRKSLHLIAEEQVEVAQLKQSLAARDVALKSQQEAILSLSDDLKHDDVRFVYAGHKYSRKEVEKDLGERFRRFQIAEDTQRQERQILAAKEQALTANRETLEGMLSQKKSLEAELERLEARMRTIDARRQVHGLAIDGSHLTRVKTLIATIEKRLDVEDAVLASEGDLQGLIPVEKKLDDEEAGDITAKIDSYFDRSSRDQMAESDQN